jgi:putative hydrolase of the HAD superfamily
LPACRAVGFDLDDTLYPERAYVLSGFEAVARWGAAELGHPAEEMAGELRALFEAGVRQDTFDRWLASKRLPVAGNRDRMLEVYRSHRPRLEPYDDVRPSLERLRRAFRLGLATEGAEGVQAAKLEALGLRASFSAVVILGEGERQRWKPDPWPLVQLAEELEVGPSEMVYAGDNPAKDFAAARRAGMRSVRLRRPDGLHAAEEPADPEAAPDVEVADLQGLEGWLNREGAGSG